jgi:hypothetical protein
MLKMLTAAVDQDKNGIIDVHGPGKLVRRTL